MMSISFPGESLEYRMARSRLLQQEVALRRATEAVAEARRELPPGGIVPQDYVFQQAGPSGTPTEVRMSELFVRGLNTLVIYNFMCPRALDDEGPCPSCTSMLDALDGGSAAHHAAHQFRGRCQSSGASPPGSCAPARLAGAAVAILGRHHLQPRLLRRGHRGRPKADAQCVPARGRSDPPLLGLRTFRRADRARAGASPHRFHRPTVKSVRLHTRRTRDRLVSGAELLLKAVVRLGID